MKAVLRTKYGSPDVLKIESIQKAEPKENEILVRVHATTVNRTDCGILRGKPFLIRFFTGIIKPSSQIPGTDFAGQIEAIGKNVKAFQVSDRVWGFNDQGLASQAEYLTIKENQAIALIPKDVGYDEAVSCGEGAHYALNFINKVVIDQTSKVLVNGATGGIGSAAIQLLKHYGAYVTAVGPAKSRDLVKSLGADKFYDYLKEDFTQDTEKYHFVFDAVGKSTFAKCKNLLLPNGIYISTELGPNAQNLYLPIITKLKGNKRVIFPIPTNCKRSVHFLNQLLKSGEFKAVIDRKYTIDEIKEAYAYVESGKKIGNVIINY